MVECMAGMRAGLSAAPPETGGRLPMAVLCALFHPIHEMTG